MKEKLTFREVLLVGSLLFGLYFGAGNLIFPLELGQKSGYNLIPVTLGFLLSGVGLPILGVAAAAISNSESLFELARPAGKGFAYFLTVLLYLSIGPGFAIPRTATVSYEVGLKGMTSLSDRAILAIFSIVFFTLALYFALKKGNLINTIGKYMTPIFLILLASLVLMAIINPMGEARSIKPIEDYQKNPFTIGIIDGYNTLDAPASLAFAIIIIGAVKDLDINKPQQVASQTLKAGLVCLIAMGLVYSSLAYMGSTSTTIMGVSENGAEVLAGISNHYLGKYGHILFSLIVFIACIKTAIGLISACSEMFSQLLSFNISYEKYCVIFAILSFLVANLGLNQIIALSIPVLMFLYPICIALMALSFGSLKFGKNHTIYKWTLIFTGIGGFFDLLFNLPYGLADSLVVTKILALPKRFLPGFDLGFGRILLCFIGFIIGYIIDRYKKNSKISYTTGK